MVPAELRGSLHEDGQQTDDEGEQPAETARHQAGPRPHLETAAADCRPSVDCQGNLDQEKGQETPVEKEGIKLTQDWVLLVVAKKYSITQRSIDMKPTYLKKKNYPMFSMLAAVWGSTSAV